MKNFEIITLNVRGIRDQSKRQQVFHWLKTSSRASIFLLQETHLVTEDEAHKWSCEWSGRVTASRPTLLRCSWWASSASPHTGGTAILIRPSAQRQFTVVSVATPPQHNGGHATVQLKVGRDVVALHSIYSPAPAQLRVQFFEHLLASPLAPPEVVSLYGGDWNTVNVVARDTMNMPVYDNTGAPQLNQFCTMHGLLDYWLETEHSDQVGFTRYATDGMSASRIDRCYVSADKLERWRSLTVAPQPAFTDHNGLLIQFRPQTKQVKSPHGGGIRSTCL